MAEKEQPTQQINIELTEEIAEVFIPTWHDRSIE